MDREQIISEALPMIRATVALGIRSGRVHPSDEDDAVQEISIRVMRTAAQYDPKLSSLNTWINMISRRYFVDAYKYRSSRRRGSGEFQELNGSIMQATHEESDMSRLDLMSADDFDVARVAVICGWKNAALALNMPIGMFKSRMKRIRHKLAERTVAV